METEAGWPRRREHRNGGGRFRAEIEMDRGSFIPRGPAFGFAAAVREPLVRLRRPRYEFERWDWGYFAWPHDRLDANLEMRDSDPEATLEADQKASESFLNRSMLQLESHEMYQHMQEQHPGSWPLNNLHDNLEMRNRDAEATLGSDGTVKELNTRQLKRWQMDRGTQEPQHEEQENEEAGLIRTSMAIKKLAAAGRRAARRRRVFGQVNR